MIRLAVSADQPEIYSLICALEETSFPQEMFAWGFYTMLSSASHLLLVAEIMELIVSREVRSKGIGAALLKAAREQAIQHHCIQFEVTSNQKRKQAHRFYQREGLEQTHIKMTEALL